MTNMAKSLQPPPPDPDLELSTETATNLATEIGKVKKQQMRWTPQGAHLLLQIRTRVLNDQLADDFQRWYHGFTRTPDTAVLAT